ncbi:hypothetical protein ACTXT7_001774 [Hymenolepis weldensis]
MLTEWAAHVPKFQLVTWITKMLVHDVLCLVTGITQSGRNDRPRKYHYTICGFESRQYHTILLPLLAEY